MDQAIDMISICFEGPSESDSVVLARRLRRSLVDLGAQADHIQILRTDKEAMDLGSIVQIAADSFHHASGAAELAIPFLTIPHVAMAVWEICHRKKSDLKIIVGKNQYKLRCEEIEVGKLELILGALKNKPQD